MAKMDKRLDWNDLRYFLAVARAGSTVAAGKALGTSQSTVHRRLAELEQHLACQLVMRRQTGYRLTELGKHLLGYAERAEEAVATFERQALASDNKLTGTLRITCGSMIGERLTRTPLLNAFHAHYPGLLVELLMTERVIDLSKSEADVAIRAGECRDEALVGTKIAEARWAVYASASYLELHGRPERKEHIERHSVVGYDGAIANYPAARWLNSTAPNAKVAARSDNWPGLILAVKSGVGLAPLQTAQGDAENDLIRLFEIGPELVTPYFLLTHRDMQNTPRVAAFLEFVGVQIEAFRLLFSGNPAATQ
jgi:DNA-binding transcriptional LysR family regulator